MLKKIIVIDTDIPALLDNSLFDPTAANKVSHTILPMCYLYKKAKEIEIHLVTPDVYLRGEKTGQALLFSHLQSSFTNRLLHEGVKPVFLTCQESPFIATRFYASLRHISGKYKHSMVFSGMQKRLSPRTEYHQMHFPQTFNIATWAARSFKEKGLLTMVSSNKAIRNWKKNALMKVLYGKDVKEIYEERLKAVNYFATTDVFDLYGFGWDKPTKSGAYSQIAVKKVYHGTVDDKRGTLGKYKFALCFENAVFPGYVTEKIFDAFFSGTIPVYYGAPDIADFLPAGTYIDMRNFSSYADLHTFLEGINEEIYEKYLQNIINFLRSPAFVPFTQEYFAEQILSVCKREFL